CYPHDPNPGQKCCDMEIFLFPAGTDSVSTVTMVSVQRGGFVTIPCYYKDRHKTKVKYWCKWSPCTPIVRTDSPQEGKVSIRDDPDQRVFTVTINNLTSGDSGTYSCGVKISEHSDAQASLSLSVTDGKIVQCRYRNHYDKGKWCKIGGSCVSMTSESLDLRSVLIRNDRVNKVFSVTMRGLERKDTGWYWCDAGGLQIPVHITVSQTTTTTTSTEGK
uniref:Ig-like domain-containing protein n=1 Tax=Paramormyrops kingsleyae TaxID=1676925 RepID=A0A3B3R285_9TELE